MGTSAGTVHANAELRLAEPLPATAAASGLFRHLGFAGYRPDVILLSQIREAGARSVLGWLDEHELSVVEVVRFAGFDAASRLGVLRGLPVHCGGEPLEFDMPPEETDLVYCAGDRFAMRQPILDRIASEGDTVRNVVGTGAEGWFEWICGREETGLLEEDPFGVGRHLGLFVHTQAGLKHRGVALEAWRWPARGARAPILLRPAVLGPSLAQALRPFDLVHSVFATDAWVVRFGHALVERASS